MKSYIKDFYGRIIASIEEKPNGDKILKDFHGNILGRYDKRLDRTKDFQGRIVAQGDSLSMLIPTK